MAGNANSGRKDIDREKQIRKLMAYSGKVILETFQKKGRFKDLPDQVIFEAMTRVYIKGMPQDVKGELEHTHRVMGRVKLNGQILEVDIGD